MGLFELGRRILQGLRNLDVRFGFREGFGECFGPGGGG